MDTTAFQLMAFNSSYEGTIRQTLEKVVRNARELTKEKSSCQRIRKSVDSDFQPEVLQLIFSRRLPAVAHGHAQWEERCGRLCRGRERFRR